MGRHNAGNDMTEALSLAPHGREKMISMTAVGELIVDVPQKLHCTTSVFLHGAHEPCDCLYHYPHTISLAVGVTITATKKIHCKVQPLIAHLKR